MGSIAEKKEEKQLPAAAELRLPTDISPTSYWLILKTWLPGYVSFPDEKNMTFDAQLVAGLKVERSTKQIVLNLKNLTIVKENVEVIVDKSYIPVTNVTIQQEWDKVAIDLSQELKAGSEAILKISYSGPINNNLGGLYQSTYTAADGSKKHLAITQLALTDARQMVPCFDEPSYKASWEVTIVHPEETTAVSNGIEKGQREVETGFLSTQFKATPRMSSYLLAMMVSEMTYIESKTAGGIRFRVWGRKEEHNATKFAMEAGVKCIEYYEKYFGIPFPLDKQDLIAVPDFALGAMENWGMVTHREALLLYHSKIYSDLAKRTVAELIAHELAHMWFGNLVTMKWWDWIWLNEGFATLFEHIGMDVISDGQMKAMDVFVTTTQDVAMVEDSSANTHPLTLKIEKSTEADEALSRISYQKGASVLNMIRAVIGEEAFKRGVHEYLSTNRYGNAESSDLWAELNQTVPDSVKGTDGNKLNVEKFARQWTDQMGHPFLIVKKLDDKMVEISQQRYKINELAKDKEKYAHPAFGFKWDVPVWYKIDNQPTQFAWLSRDAPLLLSVGNSSIVLNDGSNGFHRTLYDEHHWKRVLKNMSEHHEWFSNVTRFRIVSDAFSMALVDKLPYKDLFALLEYIRKDEEHAPWCAVEIGMAKLLEFFGSHPNAAILREYYKELMKPQFEKTNVQDISNSSGDDTMMYENMQKLRMFVKTCNMKSSTGEAELERLFQDEVMKVVKEGQKTSDVVSIAAPLRQPAYCFGVKTGGEPVFEKMMSLYQLESVQVERNALMNALSSSNNQEILKKLLNLTMNRSSGVFRFHDAAMVFADVAANDVGRDIVFEFLLENWKQLHESFKSDHNIVGKLITSCTSNIRTQAELKQLSEFHRTALHAADFNVLLKAKELAESKLIWIEKHLEEVTDLARINTALLSGH